MTVFTAFPQAGASWQHGLVRPALIPDEVREVECEANFFLWWFAVGGTAVLYLLLIVAYCVDPGPPKEGMTELDEVYFKVSHGPTAAVGILHRVSHGLAAAVGILHRDCSCRLPATSSWRLSASATPSTLQTWAALQHDHLGFLLII